MSFENGDLLLVVKPAHNTVPDSPPITDTLSKLTHVTSYPFAFKPFLGFLIGSLHTVHCLARGQFDIQHLQYSPPV